MTGTGSAVLISVFWMKMTRYTFPQGTVDFLLLKSLLSSGRILPYASPTAAAVCTS